MAFIVPQFLVLVWSWINDHKEESILVISLLDVNIREMRVHATSKAALDHYKNYLKEVPNHTHAEMDELRDNMGFQNIGSEVGTWKSFPETLLTFEKRLDSLYPFIYKRDY